MTNSLVATRGLVYGSAEIRSSELILRAAMLRTRRRRRFVNCIGAAPVALTGMESERAEALAIAVVVVVVLIMTAGNRRLRSA